MAILPLKGKILSLAEDYVLKAVLTHPDAKPALMDLISSIIGQTVTQVQICNNELPATDTNEKNERLDINCIIDDGSQVNVEMQGSKLEGIDGGRTALVNKSVYYLTDLHSTQKSKSVEYSDLVRTYQITFIKHNIFSHKGYFTNTSLRTPDGTQISDQIHLIFIELNKLDDIINKNVEDMTSVEEWSVFLGYSGNPGKRELINKILAKKEALGMAGTVLAEISKDQHERAKRRSQRKYETDIQNNYLVGKREGKAEANIETAKNLKKAGILTNAQIAEATTLSLEKIEQL